MTSDELEKIWKEVSRLRSLSDDYFGQHSGLLCFWALLDVVHSP
jgi:hypothetical protein